MSAVQRNVPALSKAAKAALQNHLDRLLSSLAVLHDWPDFENYSEMVSFHEALSEHEPWRSHVTIFDLYAILAGVIRRHGVKVEDLPPKKLVDLLTPERFDAFRKDARDHLLSIPRNYKLWVELPAMPRWGAGSIRITEQLEFVEIETTETSGRGLIAEAMAAPPVSFAALIGKVPNTVYVCVAASGYGGTRLDSTAVADGISQLKQFFQMFRRTSAFDEKDLFRLLGESRIECWIADKEYPDERMVIRLPQTLTKFISSVAIDEAKLQVIDFDKVPGKSAAATLLGSGNRKPRTREERATALTNSMD